ncbi:hypothetical protein MNB_SV-14-314 [hydrothermal vent metagenome]|uniref:Uncharacterized protein n=1 Tax=hydrothermal vent metagenome TaxID=652676 RepID=A0A1W1BV47_9ZZZZ
MTINSIASTSGTGITFFTSTKVLSAVAKTALASSILLLCISFDASFSASGKVAKGIFIVVMLISLVSGASIFLASCTRLSSKSFLASFTASFILLLVPINSLATKKLSTGNSSGTFFDDSVNSSLPKAFSKYFDAFCLLVFSSAVIATSTYLIESTASCTNLISAFCFFAFKVALLTATALMCSTLVSLLATSPAKQLETTNDATTDEIRNFFIIKSFYIYVINFI